jgi:hypothetical protein
MKLSFEETMSGTLQSSDGRQGPVRFSVQAVSEGGGFFTLSGTAQATPWVDTAKAHGSLFMGPTRIEYELRFAGFRLSAKKTPSLFRPVRSMTLMPATLFDASGATVAQGEMHFDLRDLPSFMLSWLTPARRSLPAGG